MNLYPDEPTFTLRAADTYAPKTILDWARSVLQSPNATREQFLKAAQAHQVAERMLYWQAENPDKVKVPDAIIFASKMNIA
ncbi:hypothetical protein AHMF7605_11965 [Adhaeribacter arboris]|uniref:Uncharacterized protein n=1 Tax=Adhaeribacter arboris TaxID=2072846 RepID=A0A2T2YFA2_9BACT|nr:hypothetical protein [Adhaeribacter arboris]PSR54187.1 hypothetical protein AHMF7605_11965 [Adhaeribacter arboris]